MVDDSLQSARMECSQIHAYGKLKYRHRWSCA